ncbi:hypothetical protein [Shewanella halifaxensis]|uniref:hypothetical protein n=1 Tax=Shewanella halifaxensis TaxID=271098 RepID=UPI000D59EEA7|nr:hypothetical protein [Shewanella halifaxensis]
MISMVATALKVANLTGLTDFIGNLFGGDKGEAVANKVVDIALAATGATTPEQALNDIENNAEAYSAVKAALLAHEKELTAMAHADTVNARELQATTLKSKDWLARNFIYLFSLLSFIGTGTYLACITFFTIPEQSVRFADTILGFLLGTVIAAIFNFFYGTPPKTPKVKG